MRWLDGMNKAVDMNLDKLQETVRVREAWHAAVHGAFEAPLLPLGATDGQGSGLRMWMTECGSCAKDEVSLTLVSKFLPLFLELLKSPWTAKRSN